MPPSTGAVNTRTDAGTSPTAFDAARFRDVLGHFPTGVAVITTQGADGTPKGMTVGSFSSVSLDPPLVGFFATTTSRTLAEIRVAGHFCVNVLADHQEATCRTFARSAADRFAEFAWTPSPAGAPILSDAVVAIDCAVESVLDTGDHCLVLGAVRNLHILSDSNPLLFFRGGYGSFSSPSLMARPEADTVRQLARANLARDAIGAVAEELEVACVASALVGPNVVQLVSAGPPQAGTAPPAVGTRMPWVPPIGRGFAAWGDDAVRRAYLDRAEPALSAEDRARYEQMFEVIRRRGWSVVLVDQQLSDAEQLLERHGQSELTAVEQATVRRSLAAIEARELAELHPDTAYPVRLIAAPVFGPQGTVELVLTAQHIHVPISGQRIEVIAGRLVQAAAAVAERLADADA